jgi:hypothetical protein
VSAFMSAIVVIWCAGVVLNILAIAEEAECDPLRDEKRRALIESQAGRWRADGGHPAREQGRTKRDESER